MNRLLSAAAVLLVLAVSLAPPVSAQEMNSNPKILLDELPLDPKVEPAVIGGRTFVPLRALAQALNLKVTWAAATQSVYTTDLKTSIKLEINNKTAFRNNVPIVLAAAPILHEGKTMVPLRSFCELYGCEVKWNGPNNPITVFSPPAQMQVIGFYALGNKDASSWTNLFTKSYPDTAIGNTDLVSELALGWYSLDSQGKLLTDSKTGWVRPLGWEDVLQAAEDYGLKTEMVVHVTNKDGLLTSLLNNEQAMNRAIKAIVSEAELFDGINLNFEGLGFRDEGKQLLAVQDSFTNFVSLLTEQAKKKGKTVTLTLHSLNSNYPGYDYKALGQLVDQIIIMAYDYGVKPEPIDEVIEAMELAKAQVAEEKLVLAICTEGETAASLLTKVRAAKRLNLNGIALWRLGIVSDEMWHSLRTVVKPRTVAPQLQMTEHTDS